MDDRLREAEALAIIEAERTKRAKIEADQERFRLEYEERKLTQRLAEGEDEIEQRENERRLQRARTDAEIEELSLQGQVARRREEAARLLALRNIEREEREHRFRHEAEMLERATAFAARLGAGLLQLIKARYERLSTVDEMDHQTIRKLAGFDAMAGERALLVKRLADAKPFRQ